MAFMNERLLIAAQYIMDTYYQNFAPDDSFFRLEDFGSWIGKVYSKVADDSAQLIYKSSLQENGIGQLIFSQDWWASKEFEIKTKDSESFIELDIKYLGFTYDNQNSGIQLLIPIGNKGKCGDFKRTTIMGLFKQKQMTASNIVWWYPEDNKIKFIFSGNSNIKKVKVFYIPTIEDDNFKLPASKEFEIATLAWQYMKQAETGTVISETADRNLNKTIQSESNTEQLKPLKV